MRKYRWGILATGKIAGAMAYALSKVEDAELLAVASRTAAGAERFGDQRNVPRRYARYQDLVADPDIDIVYIATPHQLHYQQTLMCLNAGKHVLCEKPITLNATQARACFELARQKGLFLMEAVWMRFFPVMAQVRQWVADGVIGKVRLVEAGFCFNRKFDPKHRLYNPELGGGALLDIGIYPLSFTTMLLGFPDEVHGFAHLGQTGVDELNAITLVYKQGAMAQLTSTMRAHKPREAFVAGSKGYIKVHSIFHQPERVTIHLEGEEPVTHHLPYLENGYPHEVLETHACLRAGRIESKIMPASETIAMMTLMDQLRAKWRLVYPSE